MLVLFLHKITPGYFIASGEEDEVQEKYLVHPAYLFVIVTPFRLAREHTGAQDDRPDFKVVIAALGLHLQIRLLAIVKIEVYVQADRFPGKVLREEFVILNIQGGDGTADTGGEEMTQGVPGVLVVVGKEAFKDKIREDIQGNALFCVFRSLTAQFTPKKGDQER
jgi:hypothetical protein